jgi:Ferritin-like
MTGHIVWSASKRDASNDSFECMGIRGLTMLPPVSTRRKFHWLQRMLCWAAALELSTIPLYLIARWSVTSLGNEVVGRIKDITRREMVHVGSALNVLKGIGGDCRASRIFSRSAAELPHSDPKISPGIPPPDDVRFQSSIVELRMVRNRLGSTAFGGNVKSSKSIQISCFSKGISIMRSNRKFRRSLFAIPAVLSFALATNTPAYAILSIFGTPSLTVAVPTAVSGAAIGGAVLVSAAGGGAYVVAGAILVAVVDPIDATFYQGSFQTYFPPNLLTPAVSGWLGDWGANPASPAPPVGTSPLPAFDIQPPNSSLTTLVTNDLINGIQTVTFDWGLSGHAHIGSGEFNFYAVAFQAKHDLLITDLGAGAGPQPGANLFGASLGITCSAAGSAVLNDSCGSPAGSNHSFAVTSTPEPASWVTFLTGFGMLGGLLRRGRSGNQRGQTAL